MCTVHWSVQLGKCEGGNTIATHIRTVEKLEIECQSVWLPRELGVVNTLSPWCPHELGSFSPEKGQNKHLSLSSIRGRGIPFTLSFTQCPIMFRDFHLFLLLISVLKFSTNVLFLHDTFQLKVIVTVVSMFPSTDLHTYLHIRWGSLPSKITLEQRGREVCGRHCVNRNSSYLLVVFVFITSQVNFQHRKSEGMVLKIANGGVRKDIQFPFHLFLEKVDTARESFLKKPLKHLSERN